MLTVGALLLLTKLVSRPPTVIGLDRRYHDPFVAVGHKPSAFFFISESCPICNTYAPEIQRIVKAYRARVSFSLVYCDRGIRATDATHHAKTFGLKGPMVYLDPRSKFSQWSGADVTPEAAVFDATGHKVYVGRIDDLYYAFGQRHTTAQVHDLRRALDATLAGRPVPKASGQPVGCYIER